MEILKGINRECNGIAGIKKLYLFSYIKHARSEIVLDGNVILSYPETDLYEFETVGDVDFSEDSKEDEFGGVYYEISLSFRTKRIENPLTLVNTNIRAIVLDNNGNYRLLGNYNGLTNSTFKNVTGFAKSEFNGYEFAFTGKEEREAFFINNIETITGNYLLQENGDYLLQENGYKIIL